MRKALLCLGLILSLCFPLLAEERTEDKTELRAIHKVFTEPVNLAKSSDTKMNVLFNHIQHQGVQCAVCHHKIAPSGKRYASCGANPACHSIAGTSTDEKSQFQAFHNRDSQRSCYGCHFEKRARFDGVKGCTTCHKNLTAAGL